MDHPSGNATSGRRWGLLVANKDSIQTLATVTQIVALIIGGAWVVYNFKLTEHKAETAPVNITLDMSLRRVGFKPDKVHPLLAVELRASATNPSARTIHLLPALWYARGWKVFPRDHEFNEDALNRYVSGAAGAPSPFAYMMKEGAPSVLTPWPNTFSIDAEATVSRLPPAFGKLTGDTSLEPGEKVNRTLVFYVPKGKYDVITVCARIISTERELSEFSDEWTLVRPTHENEPAVIFRKMLHNNRDGTQTAITDEEGDILPKARAAYGLARFNSCYDLAL